MLMYALLALAAWVAPRLPRNVLAVLGVAAGVAAYAANRGARAAVLRNLAVVCPTASPPQLRRLAMRTFIHGAWADLELFALARTRPEALRDAYSITGWEHLDAALARGHGVIMVTAHVGAPSVAGQLVALHGVKANVVVESMRPAALHRLMNGLRGAFGIGTIPLGASTVREVVGALRRNEVVGILADRDVAGSGEVFSFFGRPTRVTTAAATLARRTGAIVVPAITYRSRPFEGYGKIGPPVEVPSTGGAREDVSEGTRRLLARLEEFVRERPEQWVVFTDIWPSLNDKDNHRAEHSDTIARA
jgi:KDO2-lipid IV(A) lauroyltransferase